MTHKEQARLAGELCDRLKRHMLETIADGHVPEAWDGIELRAWMQEIARVQFTVTMTRQRALDFRNNIICNRSLT